MSFALKTQAEEEEGGTRLFYSASCLPDKDLREDGHAVTGLVI